MKQRTETETQTPRAVLPKEQTKDKYYRGLIGEKSILTEHYLDRSFELPPNLASDEKEIAEGEKRNVAPESRNHS